MPRPLAVAAIVLSMTLGMVGATRAQSPGSGSAPTPPPGFAWFVLSQLNAFYDNPEDPTDRPELITDVPDGVLTAVDINHDSEPDWLIEWPEAVQFCGTGGCERSLYVSGPEGFTRAFDRQTIAFVIAEVEGETRIEATVHHLYCEDDRPDCRFSWAWDDRARRLVQRPASDGVTLMEGTGPGAVDDDIPATSASLDRWPVEIGNLWEKSRVVCLTESSPGYAVGQATVATVPDLNGDGRPDWVVTLPSPCEGTPIRQPFQVWVTTGEGEDQDGVALAYAAEPGTGLRLEVARTAPALSVATGCDAAIAAENAQGECPFRPLRWDTATRRLKE